MSRLYLLYIFKLLVLSLPDFSSRFLWNTVLCCMIPSQGYSNILAANMNLLWMCSRAWPFLVTNQPSWAGATLYVNTLATPVFYISTWHSSLCFPPIAFFSALIIDLVSKSMSLLHSQSMEKIWIWKWIGTSCSLQTAHIPLIQLVSKSMVMPLSLWIY